MKQLAVLMVLTDVALSTAALAEPRRPKLVVAISVDQSSADLFAEHRQIYVAGMKRPANAIIFPSGFQGHAATETCPGHSTILTGSHPARTGISPTTGMIWALCADLRQVTRGIVPRTKPNPARRPTIMSCRLSTSMCRRWATA